MSNLTYARHLKATKVLAEGTYNVNKQTAACSLASVMRNQFIIEMGAITNGTFTCGIDESFDGGTTWTAANANNIVGDITSNIAANTCRTIGYIGAAPMIRGTVTVGGAPATGGLFGILFQAEYRRQPPQ